MRLHMHSFCARRGAAVSHNIKSVLVCQRAHMISICACHLQLTFCVQQGWDRVTLRRCMPFWHKRQDDQPTLRLRRCSPHPRLDEVCSMVVLPARTTTLLCLASVSFPCIRGSDLSLIP